MWKRDEAVKPASTDEPERQRPALPDSIRAATVARRRTRGTERDTVNIGKSVVIKGELSGSEDLTIEGQVEGKIELRQNVLTIGPNGKIKAQIVAKAVVIQGEVHGQRHGDASGSTSATRVRSTAICPRRAWRLPTARTSAAASTCSEQGGKPASTGRRDQKPAPTRSRACDADDVGHDAGACRRRRIAATPVRSVEPTDRGEPEVPSRVWVLQLGRTKDRRNRRGVGRGGYTCRLGRHADDLEGAPAVLAALSHAAGAGAPRSRARRRHEHLVLRRAARVQDLRRGPVRRRRKPRAQGHARSRSPLTCSPRLTHEPTTRSTAFSAGICSTSSIGRPGRRSRRDWRAAAAGRRAATGSSARRRSTCALHAVHRRGAKIRCAAALSGDAAPSATCCSRATSIKMFDGLVVAESVLLKSNTRETIAVPNAAVRGRRNFDFDLPTGVRTVRAAPDCDDAAR